MPRNQLLSVRKFLAVAALVFSAFLSPAQNATNSMPFSVGKNACGGSTSRINYYTYNSTANVIGSAGSPLPCTPQLRIGSSNFTFTSSYASVSYNPKDQNLYYFKITSSGSTTYAWKWPIGSCPTITSPRLDTIRAFPFFILGVVFDKAGNGYMLEFSSGPAPYTAFLRSIDFTTGTYGQADTLDITGGAKIYTSGTGDVALSPSGQMYFVVDNKLFTPDYLSYGSGSKKITCTYIDTVDAPAAGSSLVGLTFAQGELIAAYSGTGGCLYKEIQPLTGDTTAVRTSTSTFQSTSDFASVISGVGAAKKLVSVTPTGTANQYDVEYDVYVQNYGNYPITNVQVSDTLSNINGAANFSLLGVSFIQNPAGLVLNASYNGSTNANLLNGTGSLPNYPVEQNFAVIRIKVRLSNILQGVVYNNQAYARANGFSSVALLDASTDGVSPDLNSNDKPDDLGENQPTPLLISVTSYTPPCSALNQILFTEDFGSGAATVSPTAGSHSPYIGYTGSLTNPLALNQFKIASNATDGNSADWASLTDHTNGSGRMLMVNADAVNSVFYRDTIPVACANQQYSLIFYAAFPGNSAYQTKCNGFGGFKYPRVKINIRDAATGLIITQNSTPDIISNSWSQYGLKFVMPSGFSSVVIELVNDGLGGCGNDILIDDIQYGLCDPVPTIVVGSNSNGCLGATSIISSNITDGGVIPGTKEYQWQVSSDGTLFTDISGATAADLTLSPLAASDVNKYYRVLVAASGNMSSTACRYVSSPYLLVSKTASTNPVSISISRNNICPGDAVTLQVIGGTTGTNATWRWYSASCGGTFVGTGNSITINPSVTTTYYVRAEGDCNTTTCVSRTITIACDIDDDNDGITDLAESGGVDPFNDTDLDGILDYRDSDYAGFSDSNGDGVNDRFDNDLDGIINSLDLDSDNDGIPDVVESGGVDANGDGLIDNYSDADGDGLSQNVDGSSIGVSGSGSGLGLVDTDGDGVPNLFDLDSDNDGIPDVVEAGGTDSNNDGRIDNYTDTDQDGFSQNVDGDPNNDSIADNSSNTLLRTGSDGNGDGRADSYPYKNFDSDSRANAYDLDSDNDGISDTREAGFGDANNDGFTDGTKGIDGWDDSIDARASLGLLNSDADANLDYLDIDADNDGIPDNVEGMSTSSYRLPAYVDSDGDGIDNSYDSYNGFGGNGITPNDQDGDGVPDYIDIDTDGDGINDIVEGNDLNGNCAYDDVISLTLIDTDGDGLDNRFDNLNGSIKGTSPAMGNLGSFAGDPTPGSRTAVQTCRLNASDRDWRFVTNALSLDFMAMQAQWAPAGANIKWVVTCSAVIDHFIVERSSDGRQFFAVGSIPGTGTSCNAAPFEYLDSMNIQGGQKYQYRIRSVTLINGDKLGPVVKLSAGTDPEVRVFPNPAKQFVKVSIPAHQAGYGTIRILNVSGVELNRSVHELRKGVNTITLRHIASLAPGSYYVQVDTGEKLVIEKILVQ